MRGRSRSGYRFLGYVPLLILLLASPVHAIDGGAPAESTLRAKEFFVPELSVATSNVPAGSADLAGREAAWSRLLVVVGADAPIFLDPRSGVPTGIMTAIPMIPGRGVGNSLTLEGVGALLGRRITAVDDGVVSDLVRRFLDRNAEAMAIDGAQLGNARATQVTSDLWNVRIPQSVRGVPVRYAHVAATLSHGNLVLLGTEMWGNVHVDTTPRFAARDAVRIGFEYLGGRVLADSLWKEPALEIVPYAPYRAGETGYGHYLVWSFGIRRSGEIERWEMLVDAHTGAILSFEDTNLYDSKQIVGGVYPLTNTGICPANTTCGVLQPGTPMPFANTGLPAPSDFTSAAGVYDDAAGAATTTLDGKFVRIVDSCGFVSESGSGDGLDLGGVNGQHDCTSSGASPGDTAASRSGFYELNKLIETAKGWLPSNPWLNTRITANMNLALTCNAFYSPADGTINFFRSGGGCGNTGEIAAVFDHEWGHALDDNDSGGALSISSEAYADIASIYRLRASCVGYGFFPSNDRGCGRTADGTGFNSNESLLGSYCDLDCSGVRDTDWTRHASGAPATALGFVCTHCTTGSGPCGAQTHCSAAPSRQAAWDLVARDLEAPPLNMAREDAFNLGAKIFYQGSGNIASWHSCACGGTSDGCGATNAYPLWLAADDDDGNLLNGTPHMTAIFAAFDRHGIACGSPTPVNSGCASGPTTAPSVSATPGSNEVSLSWSAVPGAVTYRVLRTEGYAGCDFGKAMIGEVAGTAFLDTSVANDRPYYYVVQAVGTSGACMGPGSACTVAQPVACAGSVSMDRAVYGCSDTIQVKLIDHDLAGTGTQVVTIRSSVEATPEAVALTESATIPGTFTGSIATSSGPAAPNGILNVANGGTVTVRYVDASSCGAPNVTRERTAAVDCTGEPCSGSLALDRTLYTCSGVLHLSLLDSDLAGRGAQAVAVTSSLETVPETVTLLESPPGSGSFAGTIQAAAEPPTTNGRISVADLATVTATYQDASACGVPNVAVQKGASFDCAPPVIGNVRATGVTGSTATIQWDTNEPATSFVTYGGSKPPGTSTPVNPVLVTAHAVPLSALPECGLQYYSVGSADSLAQPAVNDNGGSFFSFSVGANVGETFVSPDPPVPLPPGSPYTATASIALVDPRTIVDVDVRFGMTHSFVGLATVFLRHPDGTVVTLSDRRGGTGDNFVGTVFDDEAAVWIGSGVAPFTGSFRPDGSLSIFDGKSVNGTWQLTVFDDVSGVGGTIQDFELLLTVAQPCAPSAAEDSSARLSDACGAGGVGSGNGFWDDGESAAIRVTLRNTGQFDLTGVSATVTPTTPGVAMTDDFSTYPNLARGAVADSPSPHFTAFLPVGFACGAPVSFDVAIRTDQGTFHDTFGVGTAGRNVPGGTATDLSEAFAAGIPAGWTIEDKGSGGGAARTWTTANPGNRTANAPIAAPFLIVDSAAAGAAADQDERLTTPVLNLSSALTVTLEFDSFFFFKAGGGDERGDVDVLSSKTGGDFVNVFRYQSSSANPDHRTIDITAQAAGASNVQIRFRYDDGANDNWWIVDNVKVSHTFAASCAIVPCAQVLPPSEVLHLDWSSKTQASWSLAASATSYTLYRGARADLSKLFTSAVDSCTRLTTPSTSATGITENPAPGTFTWWIVRGSNANGVGPPGSGTAGPWIHNPSGTCP